VGQPRDGDPRAAWGLFDDDAREITWKRVPYDIEAAARKIVAAGLPSRLATRLSAGR
jgi:diadenosine tetraphosphatase ApaH/serine/threonine PP2A family protein phosphatase